MPSQNIHIQSEIFKTLEEVSNAFAILQKQLRYFQEHIDTENIIAKSLTSEVIQAGTITAEEIAADTITADKMNVEELSAITANMGTITAGLMQAVTIIGSYIATSSGSYPRSEMSTTNNLFGAYSSPTNYAVVQPINSTTGAPAFSTTEGSSEIALGFGAGTASRAGLYSSEQFELRMPNGVIMPLSLFTDWTIIRKLGGGNNLQQDLDAKAGSGNLTSSAGADFRDGGIPIGTQLLKAGGGSVSWAGISIPNHQHTQF